MLKCIDRRYYEFLERELKTLVICSRNASVVYSNDYRETKHGVVVNEVKGDHRDPLYRLIAKRRGALTLKDPNEFCIRNKTFAWPETKVVIFN
jgi:hypothetical protein